jgi:hypothetical protein
VVTDQAIGEVVEDQHRGQDPHRPARRNLPRPGGDDEQIDREGDQHAGRQDRRRALREELPTEACPDQERDPVGDAEERGELEARPSVDDRPDGQAHDEAVDAKK